MINKLDEKLKAYSNEYFVDEFISCKPSLEYDLVEKKCFVYVSLMCVLFVILVLSIMFSRCLYFWCPWLLLVCLLVCGFRLRKLVCCREKILSEMACAYVEKHNNLKENLPDYGCLTTKNAQNKYIYTITNSYRADMVKRYLSNDYSITTIKALKDEIAIKDVEWGLGLISLCSLGALCVALLQWKGFDFKSGWSYSIGGTLILSAIYVIFYFGKWLWLQYKGKKHAILRETLEFMMHDQCKR